jgi:Flp pilus assembly protein TadG
MMYARMKNAQNTATQSGFRARFARKIESFRNDEQGALIIFGLIIFVLMLMIGGMAVDLMRYESVRAQLQSTADRATLAAASLTQTMDSEDVVDDYFTKAGLIEYLQGVTVVNAINSRKVAADVSATVPSLFMQMMGVDELTGPANSTAEEHISDVEITLVLDVSGSMVNYGSQKLNNLKLAASDFVDTVLAGDIEEKISITIVPFNGQVVLGDDLAANYNITTQHTFNTCVTFDTTEFSTAGISTSSSLVRADVIDPWSSAAAKNRVNPSGTGTETNYCSNDARNIVRPFLRDPVVLKAAINGMVGDGNTSIDIGAKWGLAMLDPGTQSVITNMVGLGEVPATFEGRPFAYDRNNTAKILVVMSDGENTDEHQLQTAYKTGASPIYRDPSDGSLAIYHSTVSAPNNYYVIDSSMFYNSYSASAVGTWQSAVPAGFVNLTWPEAFNAHSVTWLARYLWGNPLGNSSTSRKNIANTWISNFRTATYPATKDTQLDAVCDLAKSETLGVRVFTIAFEAPAAGQTALHGCASSDGDYFEVLDGEDAAEIGTAFQMIARQITTLKLTQ